MKKVVIIALTYNKYEAATKYFLESLYQYTDTNLFDIVVVDNGSSDCTVEKLQEFSKDKDNFTLICNPENLGYSKGNNIGIKSVLDKNYEYIALLNNDIMFTPNWMEDTLSIFETDKKLGMVSPRIQKGKQITIENYLTKYKKYLSRFEGDCEYSLEPLFCCVFIKKEVIDKIGLMDEAFTPAFWEDNDYSFRAMYAGYALARSNKTFVFHNHSTTSKSLPSDIFKRNREYFFNKHPLGRWIWEHKRSNVLKDLSRYIKESFK